MKYFVFRMKTAKKNFRLLLVLLSLLTLQLWATAHAMSLSDFFSNAGAVPDTSTTQQTTPNTTETATVEQTTADTPSAAEQAAADAEAAAEKRAAVIKSIINRASGIETQRISVDGNDLSIDLGANQFSAELVEKMLPDDVSRLDIESVVITQVNEKIITLKFKDRAGTSGSLTMTPVVYAEGKTELVNALKALKALGYVDYVLFPDNNHIVITTIKGLAYRGHFHFETAPADKVHPAGIAFEHAGDLNGDDEQDWLIIFSDGTSQVLYFDTPDHLNPQ